MVWVVLGITAFVVVLMALQVVPLLLGFALIVVGLLVSVAIGQRIDARRQRGLPAPAQHFDANRGDFHGSSSDHSWQTPQPYIDHRDGRNSPPGSS
jgi:hypothetical protein